MLVTLKNFNFFTGVIMTQNVVESRLTFIWREKKPMSKWHVEFT